MTVMISVVRDDVDEDTLARLVASGVVACDIETSGLDARQDSIGTVQIHARELGSIVLQIGDRRPDRLCRLLNDRKVRKVFHHAMFDLRFMVSHWKVDPVNIACTKIASKLLNPRAENSFHSLQNLLQSRLGVTISKRQRLSNWLANDLTPEQVSYAVADVDYLLQLLSILEGELREGGLQRLFDDCLDFIPARVRLELNEFPDVFAY